MKKYFRFFIVVSLITLILAFITSVDSQAATKNAKKEVTYKLKDGVLTIKGKGEMPKSMNFKKNKKIKEVVIKKGVTSISYKAFYKCKNLKKVKIPNTVKKIGAFSFLKTNIEKITIPKSVKVIGNEAFEDCDKLTVITLPGNFKVKETLSGATSNIMLYCNNLDTVNFNTNFNISVAKYCAGKKWNVRKKDPKYKSINGIIYTKDGKELVRVPRDVKVLNVAKGCKTFCFQAIFYEMEFYEAGDPCVNCYRLKKIVLPKTIENIDDKKYINGFYGSYPIDMDLEKIVINSTSLDNRDIEKLISNLKRVYQWGAYDKYTFDNIDKIAKMLPKQISKKDDFYILDNTILLNYQGKDTTVTIPKGIKRIAPKAFERRKCEKVILPEGIEEIGVSAFSQCKKLKEINLPNSLKKIESYAFEYTKLGEITIPASVNNFGTAPFMESSVTKVVLPESMTVIPKTLFAYARDLSIVNVPKNLYKIERQAFMSTSVDVQSFLDCKSLRIIGNNAFGYVDWKKINIPKYIQEIRRDAFLSFYEKKQRVIINGEDTKFKNDVFYAFNDKIELEFLTKPDVFFTEVLVESERGDIKTKTSETEVKWLAVKGVDGYEIVISSNKKFTKNLKEITAEKDQKKLTIDISRKWKRVYVKIRPYKIVNDNKVYGKWTTDFDYIF